MKQATLAVSLLCCLVVSQTACSRRNVSSQAPPHLPQSSVDFVDLQPGWTVRVMVPLLRSGRYLLPSSATKISGNSIVVEAGDEFLGYEKATYKLIARPDGGVRIRSVGVERWQNGKTHPRRATVLPLFKDSAKARYIRFVYLVRESEQVDHNMAIIASSSSVGLEELTRAVKQRGECTRSHDASCTWVPAGVGVVADKS